LFGPGNPARTALSMRGLPGVGKGVFAIEYGKIFGRHFLHVRPQNRGEFGLNWLTS
jgi:hypothetical protein